MQMPSSKIINVCFGSNLCRNVGNNPVNFVDPTGLQAEHTSGQRPSTLEKHQAGQARASADQARAAARQAAATKGAITPKAHTQSHIDEAIANLTKEREAAKDLLNKRKRLPDASDPLFRQISEADEAIDELKRIKAANNLTHLQGGPRLSPKTLGALRTATRTLSRVTVVAGVVVNVYSFEQIRAEEGLGMAMVKSTPVLGEVVTLKEQYDDIQETSREIVATYNKIELDEFKRAMFRREFSSRRAIEKYDEIAAGIEVPNPEYVDATRVARAVNQYRNRMLLSMTTASSMTGPQYSATMEKAETELRNELNAAVGPQNRSTKPVY